MNRLGQEKGLKMNMICSVAVSKSVLLSHSTQHHTHAFGGDTGHTHTHADEVAGEIFLLPLTHPEVLVLPQGAPGAVGSLLRRTGTRPSVQSNLGQGQDRRAIFSVLLHVFVLGFYVEETLVNTGRTCKLHTERPGR